VTYPDYWRSTERTTALPIDALTLAHAASVAESRLEQSRGTELAISGLAISSSTLHKSPEGDPDTGHRTWSEALRPASDDFDWEWLTSLGTEWPTHSRLDSPTSIVWDGSFKDGATGLATAAIIRLTPTRVDQTTSLYECVKQVVWQEGCKPLIVNNEVLVILRSSLVRLPRRIGTREVEVTEAEHLGATIALRWLKQLLTRDLVGTVAGLEALAGDRAGTFDILASGTVNARKDLASTTTHEVIDRMRSLRDECDALAAQTPASEHHAHARSNYQRGTMCRVAAETVGGVTLIDMKSHQAQVGSDQHLHPTKELVCANGVVDTLAGLARQKVAPANLLYPATTVKLTPHSKWGVITGSVKMHIQNDSYGVAGEQAGQKEWGGSVIRNSHQLMPGPQQLVAAKITPPDNLLSCRMTPVESRQYTNATGLTYTGGSSTTSLRRTDRAFKAATEGRADPESCFLCNAGRGSTRHTHASCNHRSMTAIRERSQSLVEPHLRRIHELAINLQHRATPSVL